MKNYLLLAICCTILQTLSRGQVAVSKEPFHHNIFENQQVRILDVHIPGGDTSQFHVHSTPSIFLILTDANTGSEVISEEDRSASPVKDYGNLWFEGFYIKPRIHRVWNGDSVEFHVMDIELPGKNYKKIDSQIQLEAFTFLFEEIPVRAYRLNLAPGTKISVPARKADILQILTNDRVDSITINGRTCHKKGDFQYIPHGQPIEIINGGAGKAEFVFLEIK